jgi:hypothetical protein
MANLEASAYLVLSRDRYGMNITEMRKNKPGLRPGQVAVKVKLLVDAKLFADFIPEVTATLEAGDVIEPVVEIEPAPSDEAVE